MIPSFFLCFSVILCGNSEVPLQFKTAQNDALSLCQLTDELPHFFANNLNVDNIIKFILIDRAPMNVDNREMLFCTSKSMWSLNVWDNLHLQFYLYHEKPIHLSIPFKGNISSMSENDAIELFNSPKLTYRKVFPNVACIDFYNSTERNYLLFTSERAGYYITYEMKFNDPLSGIHEFRGCGAFSIKMLQPYHVNR